jgi:hypothetical protein
VQVLVPMLVVYLALLAVMRQPLLAGAGRLIAAFALALGVAVLPQAVFAWRYPGEFTARLNADGTFQSGWLANEMVITGRSAVELLAGRVAHAFLALNQVPAFDFYGARIPLLDVMTSALFWLGMLLALWRARDARLLLLNGYFWSFTLAIGLLAIPPSADSYRMLVTFPAAMILAAIGLEGALSAAAAPGGSLRLARNLLAGLLLAGVLALNFRAYYIDFARYCRFGGDVSTRFAAYLGRYLRTVDRTAPIYLLSDFDLRYGTHPSTDFLSGGLPAINWDDPISGIPLAPGTVIIAGPSRLDELRGFARQQTAGSLSETYDCEALMLVAYEFPSVISR